MALAKALSMALDGVIAHPVVVEANIGPGLPGMHVVGRGDAAILESRDRIRTAVANMDLPWPKTKVVLSLTPADLPKSGSHFDLPMALAVLAALSMQQDPSNIPGYSRHSRVLSEQSIAVDATGVVDGEGGRSLTEHPPQHPTGDPPVPAAQCALRRLAESLIVGELSLDGSIQPVAGVVSALLSARQHGYRRVIIPAGNAAEAQLIPDLEVLVAHNLTEAAAWMWGSRTLAAAADSAHPAPTTAAGGGEDFSDIAGQREAKFAAEVAAAGGHHLMMIGPPGSGKSMIAARMPGILPGLDSEASVEATAIHSLAVRPGTVIDRAPFIAPHASVTRAALIGGGSGNPRPGAVSLAHHGILFLDEVSEVNPRVLDALRAPLEEGKVRLSRSGKDCEFPAQFQLVLAANPCRCAAEDAAACRCTSGQRRSYLSNLSGPLRDRLDMIISVSGQVAVLMATGEESSAAIADRVLHARHRAAARWSAAGLAARTNAQLRSSLVRRHYPADDTAMELLGAYLAQGVLSHRAVDRCLKVAWTLADLHGAARPTIDHISQALELRGTDLAARIAA